MQTDITFDHPSKSMRINDLYLWPIKRKRIGKKLVGSFVDIALDTGCRKLFMKPSLQGNSFWPRHGALILQWPYDIEERIRNFLISPAVYGAHWDRDDINLFASICGRHDCFGLNQSLARDDLYVGPRQARLPFAPFLIKEDPFTMYECVIDLGHSWCQDRLITHAGVQEERLRPGPLRPEEEIPFKAYGPAS